MSRLARTPLTVPSGVDINVATDGAITVKGKLGELGLVGDHNIKVDLNDDKLKVTRVRETKHARCLEGTYVSRINNMITGVTVGCSKLLELHGTGYRAALKGNAINLELGFSHPVSYELPAGIKAELPAPNRISLSGIDKVLVGQAASDIRRIRPPEPYKGKGVRYAGEHIVMKETKKK